MYENPDESRQIHAKCSPLFNIPPIYAWKITPFLDFANSRLILKTYPFFRESGFQYGIRFDREWGGGWGIYITIWRFINDTRWRENNASSLKRRPSWKTTNLPTQLTNMFTVKKNKENHVISQALSRRANWSRLTLLDDDIIDRCNLGSTPMAR